MQRATDDVVSDIMGKWATAFSKLDAGALASLYSKNAFFFGSNPTSTAAMTACGLISPDCRDGSRHLFNSRTSIRRRPLPT
jgi:ketosteroid isomerase-like protein